MTGMSKNKNGGSIPENEKYELLWHEDIGNIIYCSTQSEKNNIILEERLKKIINIINKD